MKHTCLVVAAVGEPWFRATLPPALGELLDLVFVDPTVASSIDGVVDEVERRRREHGDERVVVFGHSAQGLLALAYAAKFPAYARGVIAIGTPPTMPPDGEQRRAYWEATAEPARRERFESGGGDRLFRWYDVDFDPTAIDSLAVDIMDWSMKVNVDESSRTDWTEVRRAIRCPVLLVLGAKDFVVPPVLWEDEAPLANETRVVLDRSGHQPFHDEPGAFVEAVGSWLTEMER